MSRSLRLAPLLLIILVSIFLPTKNLHAQQGSINVSPVQITTSISSENPQRVETVSVKNNFDKKVTLAAEPYGIDKQTGSLSATEVPDEVLSEVIAISNTEFTLDPGESIALKIQISDTERLAPGGHFAAILIKQVGDADDNVGIQQAVGISMYIIKEDGAIRSLTLEGGFMSVFSFVVPSSVNLRFNNMGNVRAVPRAAVTVQSGAQIIAKGVSNVDSIPVAPGNDVTLNTPLTKLKSSWLPSKQTVNVQYRYDGQNESQVATQTFLYIPWQSLVCLTILIGIFALFRKKLVAGFKRVKLNTKRKKRTKIAKASSKPKKGPITTEAKYVKKVAIKQPVQTDGDKIVVKKPAKTVRKISIK